MGSISSARAIYGLNATGTPAGTNLSGAITIGVGQTAVSFADADITYSFKVTGAASGNVATLDLVTGDVTLTTGSPVVVDDATDFEGVDLPTAISIHGVLMEMDDNGAEITAELKDDGTTICMATSFGNDLNPLFPFTTPLTAADKTLVITMNGRAAVTIDPAGADNSFTVTSIDVGTAATSITITVDTPAADVATDVSVLGTDITVVPGTLARMISTAASDATADGVELFYAGTTGAGDFWATSGITTPTTTPGGTGFVLLTDGAAASEFRQYTAGVEVAFWADFTPGSNPSADTLAAQSGTATGDVTFTAGTSSAEQVIAAINASGAATALVTATAAGAGTGAVAPVTSTALIDTLPTSLPVIKVTVVGKTT